MLFNQSLAIYFPLFRSHDQVQAGVAPPSPIVIDDDTEPSRDSALGSDDPSDHAEMTELRDACQVLLDLNRAMSEDEGTDESSSNAYMVDEGLGDSEEELPEDNEGQAHRPAEGQEHQPAEGQEHQPAEGQEHPQGKLEQGAPNQTGAPPAPIVAPLAESASGHQRHPAGPSQAGSATLIADRPDNWLEDRPRDPRRCRQCAVILTDYRIQYCATCRQNPPPTGGQSSIVISSGTSAPPPQIITNSQAGVTAAPLGVGNLESIAHNPQGQCRILEGIPATVPPIYSNAIPALQTNSSSSAFHVTGCVRSSQITRFAEPSNEDIMFHDGGVVAHTIPMGPTMLDVNQWATGLYTPAQAAAFITGEVRGRYPVLFDIMRQAGAPVAQIAREIMRREALGIYYQTQAFFVDPVTGCLTTTPPPGTQVVHHVPVMRP